MDLNYLVCGFDKKIIRIVITSYTYTSRHDKYIDDDIIFINTEYVKISIKYYRRSLSVFWPSLIQFAYITFAIVYDNYNYCLRQMTCMAYTYT